MSNTSVKVFFSTKASGGFACPRQILVGGGGEGLNTPVPLPPLPMPKVLIGKVDQCWRISIFLYGHFLLVREPQFPKIRVKADGEGGIITYVMAILVGRANKPRWARAVKLRGDWAVLIGLCGFHGTTPGARTTLNFTSRYWSTCRSKSIPLFYILWLK